LTLPLDVAFSYGTIQGYQPYYESGEERGVSVIITGDTCPWGSDGEPEIMEVAVICDPNAGFGRLSEEVDYTMCSTHLTWRSIHGVCARDFVFLGPAMTSFPEISVKRFLPVYSF
jgi:hypothetical protein